MIHWSLEDDCEIPIKDDVVFLIIILYKEINMKNVILMIALATVCSTGYAGECADGSCSLRSRAVNVTREIVAVPVAVTRRTVEATRNVGRRTVARVRSVVR